MTQKKEYKMVTCLRELTQEDMSINVFDNIKISENLAKLIKIAENLNNPEMKSLLLEIKASRNRLTQNFNERVYQRKYKNENLEDENQVLRDKLYQLTNKDQQE